MVIIVLLTMELITIGALIFSIVLHEIAHGYAANWLGDPTARLAGRLSVNPIKHLDLIGSIIVPGFLLITGSSVLFGWAKPVPYNPYNLRHQKWGEALVAAAGPAVNILIALVFSVLIRLQVVLVLPEGFIDIAVNIVLINIVLALFNLVPIPPLDGSKILSVLLPPDLARSYGRMVSSIQRFGFLAGFIIIFIFISLFGGLFARIVGKVFQLFTGLYVF